MLFSSSHVCRASAEEEDEEGSIAAGRAPGVADGSCGKTLGAEEEEEQEGFGLGLSRLLNLWR
jgi:hypothetical protein